MAKTKAYTDDNAEDEKLGRELEVQNEVYKMSFVDAMRAEKKTLVARGSNEGLLACQIGSADNIHTDIFSDEQVGEIIKSIARNKKFIIVKGTHMYAEDALTNVDEAQRNRVLKHFNASIEGLEKIVGEPVDKDMQQLLDKIQRNNMASGYVILCNASLSGSTPPQMRQSPFARTRTHTHTRKHHKHHKHTHTHIYIYIYICIYIYTHPTHHTHAHTHTPHTHTRTHTRARTHTHTRAHTHTQARTHARTHAHI